MVRDLCQELWRLPRKLAGGLLLVLLAAGGGWSPPAEAGSGADAGRPDSLVILHTNDTHAHLVPFQRDDGTLAGGAAARAALIERERDAAPMLLLDGGDVFQGTPYFNFFRGVPDYRAMSIMGYDAGCLGNHDLDDGPAAWLHSSAEARFGILSANVFVAAESSWAAGLAEVPAADYVRGAHWVGGTRVAPETPLRFLAPASVIRTISGLKVALLGLTTDEITHIVEVQRNAGVAVADPIAVAREVVPELRKSADVVICITHLGVDRDRELAARVPGIDLIVGGHSHTRLMPPILVQNGNDNGYAGTVIVQAGYRGEFLGRMVLYLKGGRPDRYSGTLLPVLPAEGEDSRVAALIQPFSDSIRMAMAHPVFRTADRIPSNGLRDGETPLGNFVADVIRQASGADLAIINSGGIRAGLPQGEITVGDVYTTLPFDNKLVVVPMPGWQVRELLDFVARRVGKGGFAQVSGVSFVIHGDRAANVKVGGKTLDSDRLYRVGTVDFLVGGGDGYTIFSKAATPEESGLLLHDAAVQFLLEHPAYRFRKESRIVWEGSTRGLRDLGVH